MIEFEGPSRTTWLPQFVIRPGHSSSFGPKHTAFDMSISFVCLEALCMPSFPSIRSWFVWAGPIRLVLLDNVALIITRTSVPGERRSLVLSVNNELRPPIRAVFLPILSFPLLCPLHQFHFVPRMKCDSCRRSSQTRSRASIAQQDFWLLMYLKNCHL